MNRLQLFNFSVLPAIRMSIKHLGDSRTSILYTIVIMVLVIIVNDIEFQLVLLLHFFKLNCFIKISAINIIE